MIDVNTPAGWGIFSATTLSLLELEVPPNLIEGMVGSTNAAVAFFLCIRHNKHRGLFSKFEKDPQFNQFEEIIIRLGLRKDFTNLLLAVRNRDSLIDRISKVQLDEYALPYVGLLDRRTYQISEMAYALEDKIIKKNNLLVSQLELIDRFLSKSREGLVSDYK